MRNGYQESDGKDDLPFMNKKAILSATCCIGPILGFLLVLYFVRSYVVRSWIADVFFIGIVIAVITMLLGNRIRKSSAGIKNFR